MPYLLNLCSDILNKSKHHHGRVIILSTVRLLSEQYRLEKYLKWPSLLICQIKLQVIPVKDVNDQRFIKQNSKE